MDANGEMRNVFEELMKNSPIKSGSRLWQYAVNQRGSFTGDASTSASATHRGAIRTLGLGMRPDPASCQTADITSGLTTASWLLRYSSVGFKAGRLGWRFANLVILFGAGILFFGEPKRGSVGHIVLSIVLPPALFS